MADAEERSSDEVRVVRWSGIWPKGGELRVGVRFEDGGDGLLIVSPTGAVVEGEPVRMELRLLVQGRESDARPVIPDALRRVLEQRLSQGRGGGILTLRDIDLS